MKVLNVFYGHLRQVGRKNSRFRKPALQDVKYFHGRDASAAKGHQDIWRGQCKGRILMVHQAIDVSYNVSEIPTEIRGIAHPFRDLEVPGRISEGRA